MTDTRYKHSWTELSDTTNLSDESVLARLRQTALFSLFERAFSHGTWSISRLPITSSVQ